MVLAIKVIRSKVFCRTRYLLDSMGTTPFGLSVDERLLQYNLGDSHPMNANRIFPAYHLFNSLFLELDPDAFELVTPVAVDETLLRKTHQPSYLDTFRRLSKQGKGTALEYGLGTGDCPVFGGMAESAEFVVSSTVTMAERLFHKDFGMAFVLLGGLHHASQRQASGFCYLNDINVAIQRLKELQDDIKILYIDTDLHHGDGTQYSFYNDPQVLTLSFHESGKYLFPGSGFSDEVGKHAGTGFSINLPFYPYSTDSIWQQRFEHILPIIFQSYHPDFVIWQAGVDGHVSDPLGHLQLTTATYEYLGTMIRKLAIETMDKPRVLGLGGGGYNPDSVARSWAHAVAGLADHQLPKYANSSWVELCKARGIKVSGQLSDHIEVTPMWLEVIEKNDSYYHTFQQIMSRYFAV